MSMKIFRRPIVKYPLMVAALFSVAAMAFNIYQNRPLSVQTVAVERDVIIRVFGLGTVEARIRSDIGFEVSATLVELNADHGDRVRQGQVLARLNLGEQKARAEKAKAALSSALANVKKAEANLEKALVILAQRQDTNKRKQALADRNVVSREIAEEAQRDEDVAKADVLVARSEIEVAKAFLTDARAQIQYEETLMRHRTLVAPYDALVIKRHKELGSVVKSGDPIFTLVALGSYWGLAYIDEARAGFIREGQKVDARLRSRPQDAYSGTVARIDLESDRLTEERRVFIKGDNPPPQIFLGEQVEFWVTVAQLDEALLVPEAAVQGYDGLKGQVWTVETGRLQQRTVSFSHRTEDGRLEIIEGVPKDAQVVSHINNGFRVGRAVRVTGSEAK